MYLFFLLCLTAIAIAAVAWIYLTYGRKALDQSMKGDNAGKPLVRLPDSRAKAWLDPAPAMATATAAPSPAMTPTPSERASAAKAQSDAPPPRPEGPLFTAPDAAPDKLTDIKGIGPVAERQLKEQGITTFAQIAGFSDADIQRVDDYMSFSSRQVKDWKKQAKKLA